MRVGKKFKYIVTGMVAASVIAAAPFVLYLQVVPKVVSSPKAANFVSGFVKKSLGADLEIKGAQLYTSLTPEISFKIDEMYLKKDNSDVFTLQNFDTRISFAELLKKHVIIKKFGADYIFADVNKLMALAGPTDKKQDEKKESDWNIDFFDAKMYVKKCLFTYKPDSATDIRVLGKDFEINNQDVKNYIRFKVFTEFKKNNKRITIAAADKDRIYIENHKINIDNFSFYINRSKVNINAFADNKKKYRLEASTNNFRIKDVIDIVESNLIINNGSMLLAGFKDLDGTFNSKVVLENRKIDGKVTLNDFSCILLPLNNLQLKLQKGEALINNKDIILKDVEGYYGKEKSNSVKMYGGIYDYFKTAKTVVTTDAAFTNEFAENHLSKIVGYPFEVVGKGGSRIIFEALGDKMDLTILGKVPKGSDILVDGMSFSPVGYDRAVKAVMHFKGDNINIETINYYIAETIQKGSKVKPILTINGNVSMAGVIRDIGFDIPNPLPSEFLNLFVRERVFKKGTIAGNLHYINTGKYPTIQGDMRIQKMRIPSQRLVVREATLKTNEKSILLNAKGRFRRAQYDLSGDIQNAVLFPIVVNDINLKIDKLDVDRILASFNNQTATTNVSKEDFKITKENDIDPESDTSDDAAPVAFNPGMLIIKKCKFNLVSGSYNEIAFGNIIANLTLDENSILSLDSNRFDIAEGISSTKVRCDLKNHKYYLRLGVKDVNSDIMATSLLALKREISGKASGLIELTTDSSLKLNGVMKFAIKDGTIQKIGLVEYVLKFASLFRNPLAMISPSTFADLVNVPEGNFDKISGELRINDNIISRIKITSQAPQLSALIVGRFNLETRDATLRIYTKMSNENKGFAGFLRNISLNSLANRVPLSSRNDSNYYSAELSLLPEIEADERDCQVFLTTVDGDVEHNNFLSSLKRIK